MFSTADHCLVAALSHDRAGREPEAIPLYRQALELGLNRPDTRTALVCLASSLRNTGEHAEALAVIERARATYPDDNVVDAFTALIYLDNGQPARAVQTLGLALCGPGRTGGIDTGFRATLADKYRTLDTAPGLGAVARAGDSIAAISAMISGSYPPGLDAEAHMWRRHQKVANEAGEVLDAIEGAIGENPRKGVVATWDDVDKELLDTATAALGAREHNHGNDGSSIPALLEHIEYMRSRLVAALAGGTS